MSGITDLDQLLALLNPQLAEGACVVCSFRGAQYGDLAWLKPLAAIQEAEGLTLVVDAEIAERAHLDSEESMRRIVLGVHSSLAAVGLTAAVSNALAAEGISANMLAGYYHDQVLVPAGHAQRALAALQALTGDAADS